MPPSLSKLSVDEIRERYARAQEPVTAQTLSKLKRDPRQGVRLIYETLKKINANTDGDALIGAAKGMAWESPRGAISIDPATRDIVQTVYMRRVEKVGGELVNVEFDKMENVKDPVKARATN